jgi:hypothetical protein
VKFAAAPKRNRDSSLKRYATPYTQALITQMAQTAVCNRHHSVDQQLCRWLLLSLDRLFSNELSMTQELIACCRIRVGRQIAQSTPPKPDVFLSPCCHRRYFKPVCNTAHGHVLRSKIDDTMLRLAQAASAARWYTVVTI